MPRRAQKADATTPNSTPKPRLRPAQTVEARENQLISLAYDLVEERLRNGTATSQETTHFLRMGSAKERLEREILKRDMELKEAKTDMMRSAKRVEELYANAMSAFRQYNGQEDVEDEDL